MRTAQSLQDEIEKANHEADERMRRAWSQDGTSSPATPYSKAKRIRGQALAEKNHMEPHWPGERTDFEIDRDQVIFNANFARLARKTQVFIGQGDVLYKNRLMHTLEVVQFARSVAKKNNLNVDLAEAIAYGHDIGHTPFGHAGEEALNQCLFELHIRRLLNWGAPANVELGRGDDTHARRDQVLWTMVQSLVGRYPEHDGDARLLTKTDVSRLVSADLFNEIHSKKIICIEADKCFLAHPYDWSWPNGQKDIMVQDFWLQKGHRDYFLHNVHALRVLLCDTSRPKNDVTFQTAWGILAHSGRQYEEFNCYLAEGMKPLKKSDHQTNEAFLVQQSDDICFANSDLDDADRSKIIRDFKDLPEPQRTTVWRLAAENPTVKNSWPRPSQRLQFLETGFHFDSVAQLEYKYEDRVKAAREIVQLLVYPVLVQRQVSAKRMIRDLFWFYSAYSAAQPRRDVEIAAWEQLKSFFVDSNRKGELDDNTPERLAVDFIAHMTDDETMAAYRALFAPDQSHWARHFMREKADS
ncbi:MAG: HD domain-containing protein [Planctomycetota bacterium]|nr:HD domain-containing protein [Planctomycetota bacterium]